MNSNGFPFFVDLTVYTFQATISAAKSLFIANPDDLDLGSLDKVLKYDKLIKVHPFL